MVTEAPKRALATSGPKTVCLPLTLAALANRVKPVENVEIRCAASPRADRREHWGLGELQGGARKLERAEGLTGPPLPGK